MVMLKEHEIKMVDPETGADLETTLAHIKPASKDTIDIIQSASVDDRDGKSQWMVIRLQNGDLIVGYFPQGDTYLEICDIENI